MSSALLEQGVLSGEEDMRQYLQDIRRFPLLTPEEERELAIACAAGDEEAIRKMVNSNLRLVVSIAREYAGRGVPVLDLIQEGSIGLLVAAKKFDHTRQTRFSTYATHWIRRGITQCIFQHTAMIHVPKYTAERIRKVLTAKAELYQKTGEQPTGEEIAQESGIPLDKAEKLLQMLPEIYSLDAPAQDGEDATVQMLLEDIHAPQPLEELVRRELVHILDDLLGQLDDRQREILRLHFGLEDDTCYSLEQISKRLNISKERARQVEQQAMKKLKALSAGLGLEDFLNG